MTDSRYTGGPELAPKWRPQGLGQGSGVNDQSAGAPDDLLGQLRAAYADGSRRVAKEWHRSVPFGDLVVDRWERARMLGFGPGSSIYDSALVLGDVSVGAETWIGPGTVLDGSGGLTIGGTCSISAGVQIYTHDSVRWALSGGAQPVERAPVRIGDRTYVGPMSLITKGVTIGRCCVIGANSIVNKDLPDYAIAVGSTCRIVGHVTIDSAGEIELVYDTPGG
jgi:acetyltransferase-like isoleucine patch superfamily enzyme